MKRSAGEIRDALGVAAIAVTWIAVVVYGIVAGVVIFTHVKTPSIPTSSSELSPQYLTAWTGLSGGAAPDAKPVKTIVVHP
jgi:hypothetical protein